MPAEAAAMGDPTVEAVKGGGVEVAAPLTVAEHPPIDVTTSGDSGEVAIPLEVVTSEQTRAAAAGRDGDPDDISGAEGASSTRPGEEPDLASRH